MTLRKMFLCVAAGMLLAFSGWAVTVTETGVDYVFNSTDTYHDVTMNFSRLPAGGGDVTVSFNFGFPNYTGNIQGGALAYYWTINTTSFDPGDIAVCITFEHPGIVDNSKKWGYWSDDVNEWMISSGTVNTTNKTIRTPSIDHFTPFCITNGYVQVGGKIGDIVPIYTNDNTWFGNITEAATSLVPSTGLLAGIHAVVGFNATYFGFTSATLGDLWAGNGHIFSHVDVVGNLVTIDVGSDALSGAEADAIKSAIDMTFSITGIGENDLVLSEMKWCDLMLNEEDASPLGNGHTKFYLGDFTKNDAGVDTGDGYVDDWDLKDLATVYWNNPTIKAKYDIGPTEDGYITDMPEEPDLLIDFEDLMLFGISYSFVSDGEGYPISEPLCIDQSCSLRVDDNHDTGNSCYYPQWITQQTGWDNQTFAIDMVAPSTDGGVIHIKGIDVTIEFDTTFDSLVTFTAGDMWDNATPPHSGDAYGKAFFAKTTKTGANWRVRANAVRLMGTVGTGKIAEATFEVMKPGHSDIVITSCDVRDSVNASFAIPGTLNVRVKFYLGDFAYAYGVGGDDHGDGEIEGRDVNFFSNVYWRAAPDPLYYVKGDIGPTVGGYVDTWPLPDQVINFRDLWVFTRAHSLVNHNTYPYDAKTEIPDGEAPNRDKVEVSLGTPGMVDGMLEVPVELKGEVYDVQVVSLKLHYNPTVLRYIGVERGEILTEGEPAMMMAKLADIGELWVDAGCLEISGIDEAGRMLTVRFERVTDGAYELSLDDVHVLDIWNRVLCGPQTGTEDKPLPSVYALSQNYPNPVGNKTAIRYALPERTAIEIAVYNLLGERVAVLATGTKDAGFYTVIWNTDNVPSGVYFYAMKTERFTETKKILVMK
ncbi:T9SS type A sorting domain-containing protein [candidate division WOR-3 bacterium]|nr:T9SS type A sorting domain-containing protein [candidate division WOR-3 bacterium]